VRFAPDSRSAIWLKGGLFREDATDDETQRVVLPDSSIVRDTHFHFKPEAKDLALRHTFVASDRFEWTWGVEEARGKTPSFLSRDADVHFDGQPADTQTLDETDRDRSRTAYALARIGNRDLRWEIGGAWREYRKDRDITVVSGSGDVIPVEEHYRRRAGDPMAGVTWRFAPAMLVRAACRRWLRPASLDTMAPVAVAGMALEDQLVLPGGRLDQCRGQWEWSDGHATFAMARYERTRVPNLVSPLDGVLNNQSDLSNPERLRNRVLAQPPKPDLLEDTPVYGEGVARRATLAFERIVDPRVTARAYYTYRDTENTDPAFSGRRIPYLPRHQASVGASLAPGHHIFLTAYAVYRTERFADEANTQALPSGWDAQLDVFVETPDKRWSVEA